MTSAQWTSPFGPARAKVNTPLPAYCDFYCLARSQEGKGPRTPSIYLSNPSRFAKHLEDRLGRPAILSDCTPDGVVECGGIRRLQPKGVGHPDHKVAQGRLSPLSIEQYVRTLKGFATWLREKRYTRSNVLKELQRPKVPTMNIEPLTEAEIRQVFTALDNRTLYGARNYAIILTFLDTGLRCGELCGLGIDDVHLESKQAYVKVLGKGQTELIVYLGRRSHEALLSYRTFVRPRTRRTARSGSSS